MRTVKEILRERQGLASRVKNIFDYHFDQIVRELIAECKLPSTSDPETYKVLEYFVDYLEDMNWPFQDSVEEFIDHLVGDVSSDRDKPSRDKVIIPSRSGKSWYGDATLMELSSAEIGNFKGYTVYGDRELIDIINRSTPWYLGQLLKPLPEEGEESISWESAPDMVEQFFAIVYAAYTKRLITVPDAEKAIGKMIPAIEYLDNNGYSDNNLKLEESIELLRFGSQISLDYYKNLIEVYRGREQFLEY